MIIHPNPPTFKNGTIRKGDYFALCGPAACRALSFSFPTLSVEELQGIVSVEASDDMCDQLSILQQARHFIFACDLALERKTGKADDGDGWCVVFRYL